MPSATGDVFVGGDTRLVVQQATWSGRVRQQATLREGGRMVEEEAQRQPAGRRIVTTAWHLADGAAPHQRARYHGPPHSEQVLRLFSR